MRARFAPSPTVVYDSGDDSDAADAEDAAAEATAESFGSMRAAWARELTTLNIYFGPWRVPKALVVLSGAACGRLCGVAGGAGGTGSRRRRGDAAPATRIRLPTRRRG